MGGSRPDKRFVFFCNDNLLFTITQGSSGEINSQTIDKQNSKKQTKRKNTVKEIAQYLKCIVTPVK